MSSLLRRRKRGLAFRDHRAFGHHCGGASDRIREVEVVDGRYERRLVGPAAKRRHFLYVCNSTGGDLIDALQVWMRTKHRLTQLEERIIRQLVPEYIGERPQDRPIFARI